MGKKPQNTQQQNRTQCKHALKYLTLCRGFGSVPQFYSKASATPELDNLEILQVPFGRSKDSFIHTIFDLKKSVCSFLPSPNFPLLKSVRIHTIYSFLTCQFFHLKAVSQ